MKAYWASCTISRDANFGGVLRIALGSCDVQKNLVNTVKKNSLHSHAGGIFFKSFKANGEVI